MSQYADVIATAVLEDKLAYARKQSSKTSHFLVNSIVGPFNYTRMENEEGNLVIPEVLREYLSEYFIANKKRGAKELNPLSNVTLDDVNSALNAVWEGPGSLEKVVGLTWELRTERKRKAEEEDK